MEPLPPASAPLPPQPASVPSPAAPALGPPRERRWLPSIAVVSALFVVVFGGYVTAGALSEPAGPPVTVGGLVRVSPLSGWELAGRIANPPGAELTRGSGNLDVIATPFSGSPLDLTHEYVHLVLQPIVEPLSVSSRVEGVRLSSGLTGVRIFYIGRFGRGQTAIEGEITAVVSATGVGAVFDGWAPQGLLQYAAEDIQTMIDSAEVR